jgi:LPXTG-motif cell wall-anchored protein
MKKIYLVTSLLVLLALLIPTVVYAQYGVYYCAYNAPGPGNGSYASPWRCSNASEVNTAVTYVCRAGGGTLYEIVSNGYYIHTINANCAIISTTFYPGYPPSTGVEFPALLVVGGAVALGLVLLAAGFLLRRRSLA